MSFQSREKRRLAAIAAEFGATTHVLPYEQLVETLHPSYRERTLAYFAKHKIKWWVSGTTSNDRNSARTTSASRPVT